MKTTTFSAAVIGACALMIGGAALASEHEDSSSDRLRQHEHVMRAVANAATPGDAAYGWRYFSDADGRAVVISPDGIYYLNQGEGRLVRVAAAAPAA